MQRKAEHWCRPCGVLGSLSIFAIVVDVSLPSLRQDWQSLVAALRAHRIHNVVAQPDTAWRAEMAILHKKRRALQLTTPRFSRMPTSLASMRWQVASS